MPPKPHSLPGLADNVVPLRKARQCPNCGKPSARELHPFCSQRCADVDLNRWLSGAYAIASAEEQPGSGEKDSVA